MTNEERYELIQKTYRKKYLLLQAQLEKEFSGISKKLMEKINRIAFDYSDAEGKFLVSQRNQINAEIEAVSYWLSNEIKDWLDKNIVKAANIAIEGQDNATEYYIRSLIQQAAEKDKATLLRALGGNGVLLRVRYGEGLAVAVRNTVWKTRWSDGFALSERVWKYGALISEELQDMVEQCVNQGLSAVNFSRAVEQYLDKPGPSWTTAIRPSVTGRGNIKYNALRLARTETNNAYREAQSLSAKESDIVKGIKWNLSHSHTGEHDCECEKFATQDLYGLGPGVYPPDKIPISHPNCMCYLTDVLYEGEELIQILEKKYVA